jgi:hypothetical protein
LNNNEKKDDFNEASVNEGLIKPVHVQPKPSPSSNIKIEIDFDEEIDFYDDDDYTLYRPTRIIFDDHHRFTNNQMFTKSDSTNKIQLSLSSSSSFSTNVNF